MSMRRRKYKYIETETYDLDLACKLYAAIATLFFSQHDRQDSFEITAVLLALGFIVRNPLYDGL